MVSRKVILPASGFDGLLTQYTREAGGQVIDRVRSSWGRTMHWKLKAHALAILSRMPGGRRLYHRLQRQLGTNTLDVERDLNRAFELVELIRQSGHRIEGAVCLEIGTGWRPFVPIVLALGGARRVITLDVNPWLTFDYAWETWRALEPELSEVAAHLGLPESEVRDRYAAVNASTRLPRNWKNAHGSPATNGSKPAGRLSDLLGPLKIEYVYPGDARATDLDAESVDIVLSSNVLEHIPRDVQEEIHRESLRVLRPGGISVHRFNPQDHYSTVDPALTHGNFLRYSSREWHWYGGSGLAYHNRLRSRDYREMLQQAGFEIAVCRERVDERTLQAIRSGQLPVHEEFCRYTLEELAVDYIWIACEKPRTTGERGGVSPPIRASFSTRLGD
jgi:SAM-dependent methyltransferase